MAVVTAIGWGRGLLRATLIGTVLQLALVAAGHYNPDSARLFAALTLLASLAAGFLAGRWSGGLARQGAGAGGLTAGAACALVGLFESYYLGQVTIWVVAFAAAGSALTGAVGGLIGRATLKDS
jgi:hypothetical protein